MRAPIRPVHIGSGEPMLLLHPFMLSQAVWQPVVPRLAGTGRYEVFAPTMAGHNGGPRGDSWLLSVAVLADGVERQLDELGWETAHIVGNSLGGWVAFELACRGRARTVTGIAPAGGWSRWTPVKFEVIGKFVAGLPVWLAAMVLGPRVLRLPLSRRLATLPISGSPAGIDETELLGCVDDASHCPAYYRLLLKALLQPGLSRLGAITAPAHLVNCARDRVVPAPRFTRKFVAELPGLRVSTLDGVGHIPMFEAPERVAAVITDFVDEHIPPVEPVVEPPAS